MYQSKLKMTRYLQLLALAFCTSGLQSGLHSQNDIVAGDPIAFGQTMPGYDLLEEIVEAKDHPKSYVTESTRDLTIKASTMVLDLTKEDMIEFSARSEWAKDYVWKFGDGTTKSGFQHVKHKFKKPGKYEVAVFASNDLDVAKQTINVEVIDRNNTLNLEEMEHYYVFPVDNKLEADFQLNLPKREKNLRLEMKDIAGSRIYQYDIGRVKKKQKIHVDLKNLEPGKYYAVLKGKKYSLVSLVSVAR